MELELSLDLEFTSSDLELNLWELKLFLGSFEPNLTPTLPIL